MPSLIGEMIGEYRIVESLGAGGMGEVYKAIHRHLGRVIAVKVLSPELTDGAALERFYSEASIQASLQHPGVAEYLGFHRLRDRPCILMEYVDGPTLGRVISQRGAMPAEEALRVLHRIAEVVAHFHRHGVVHRDLKPSNVKLCAGDRVKILDFGIARHQRQTRLTRAGAVIGTPDSLAPEQIGGGAVTPATDVWQLGVLFYEMLTGRPPFASGDTQETYARILAAGVAPVAGMAPEARRIVERCLRKDPSRRFADAGELCRALETRASRRKPWAIAASALFAVVLAGFGVRSCTTERPENLVTPAAQASAAEAQVAIETVDGPAQVYVQGRWAGVTPFRVESRPGDRVDLVLKRSGFRDLPVQFETSERRSYAFSLEPLKER